MMKNKVVKVAEDLAALRVAKDRAQTAAFAALALGDDAKFHELDAIYAEALNRWAIAFRASRED